jgi:hypothetical protein
MEKAARLASSPDVTGLMKSRMRWARGATHIQKIRNAYKILVSKHEDWGAETLYKHHQA